jgi:hypothetical protein
VCRTSSKHTRALTTARTRSLGFSPRHQPLQSPQAPSRAVNSAQGEQLNGYTDRQLSTTYDTNQYSGQRCTLHEPLWGPTGPCCVPFCLTMKHLRVGPTSPNASSNCSHTPPAPSHSSSTLPHCLRESSRTHPQSLSLPSVVAAAAAASLRDRTSVAAGALALAPDPAARKTGWRRRR